MDIPRNVGEIDRNVRMFLAVPCLVAAAVSAIAYHAYLVTLGALAYGAFAWTTGALRYSPAYHLLRISTRAS